MDDQRLRAVLDWPMPRLVQAVQAFLGLAGYYSRFIKDYGAIMAPLTGLLYMDGFAWGPATEAAFHELQRTLTTAPILKLPDFKQQFVVECDASGAGIGGILYQRKGAIAFFSHQLALRHTNLVAYERELIGLVQAMRHWRPYLWSRTFLIRTDHYVLKFLLDQWLSTIPQHLWVSKLVGSDFHVEDRPGSSNVVADALSHRDIDGTAMVAVLSAPTFHIFDALRHAFTTVPELIELHQETEAGGHGELWHVIDGLVTVKGKVYVPATSPVLEEILAMAHGVAHEGTEKTLHRLCVDFFITGAQAVVCPWVRTCLTCQKNKTEQLYPAGLLQPLQVPSAIWADIAINFIEGHPMVGGKSYILTVVDRFAKYSHFHPLGHAYTTTLVVRLFFDNIIKLHGIPSSIVSDHDPTFTDRFWRELFDMAGVKLQLSSAFHPLSDGQSEVTKKIITMYLRCLTGDRPREWCMATTRRPFELTLAAR
jgi:hypothetical protein